MVEDDELTLEETHHPEVGEEFEGQHGRRFAVFVQWERGEPHQYEESVVSTDPELALSQARETIERRWSPHNIWVVRHKAIKKTRTGDKSLSRENTDKSYRTTAYYAQNLELPDVEFEESDDEYEEVFGDD